MWLGACSGSQRGIVNVGNGICCGAEERWQFFQPMRRVSGKATSCYPPWVPVKISPSFRTSSSLSPIRQNLSSRSDFTIYTGPSLGSVITISLRSRSSERPYCTEYTSVRVNISEFILLKL